MPTIAKPPGPEAGSLFFNDARACRTWLASLAVSPAGENQSALLDALRVFNRAPFEPLERLKCLELLRERVAFTVDEQRKRLGRGLPLVVQDAAAWSNARALLEEMESGYRRSAAEPALEAHAALIAHRVLRYLDAQMALHALVHRRFDAALWSRLHRQYAAAEQAALASQRVKDSLESEGGVSSVMEAFARAILRQAAPLREMAAPELAFAESLLRLWIRKVAVIDHAPADSPTSICPLVVDLTQPVGARPLPRDALASTQRVIDAEGLARSIRRRIRALQNGEDVATLGLPPEASAVDPLHALQRLAKGWCEPAPREQAGKAPRAPSAGLLFGAADIHFFLSGGKAFEQPDHERELSHREKEDIAVFGRVTQRTQSMMATGHSYSPETWDMVEESTDWVRLRRPAKATKTVAIGRLVGVRVGDDAPLLLGHVRALADEPEGLLMTVALFPGQPEAAAVRGPSPPWSQGFVLPAIPKLGVPASIVAPASTAFRGRPVFVWKDGAVEARVQDVLDRGADFDRATML